MKYLDYLFWSYYCFFERHKKFYFGDNRWQAIGVMYSTIIVPLATMYVLTNLFILDLPDLPERRDEKILIAGIVSLPIFLFLNHRYYHNKKITKNKFQMFREQWGNDPRANKKGRLAVIVYTVCTSVLPWFGPIILYFIYR